MNFGEVIDLTNNIIDETDYDEQVEIIIKNAINFAYLTIATKIDKRSETLDISYSKIYKLPKNCSSIIDILSGDYILSNTDYSVKADTVIFHTSKYNNLTLLYSKTVDPLVSDTDVLDIDERYCFACAMYGAYAYSIHRKRIELSDLLLSDFNKMINTNKTTEMEVNEFDITRYNSNSN